MLVYALLAAREPKTHTEAFCNKKLKKTHFPPTIKNGSAGRKKVARICLVFISQIFARELIQEKKLEKKHRKKRPH